MSRELEIAQQVLSYAASSGAQVEVSVDGYALALTRFANSFIHQNVAETTTSVRLRLHLDGRTATGSTTGTSADGLRNVVERTLAAARHGPSDPGWPGLAPPAPLTGEGSYDEATAGASPAERAERVAAFVAAAAGLETAGYCQTATWTGAVANSAGQAATGRTTEATMDGIARLDGADGVARIAAGRLCDIDGAAQGTRAAAKARAAADPVELPAGRYEVVLEPVAVVDVLDNLARFGFNGKAVVERRSFVAVGEPQFDPAVTLADDGPEAGGPGRPFDNEGTPKRRLVLVEAGVTRAVAHDRRTAAQAGTGSTGHALPTSPTWGPMAISLSLAPAAPGSSPESSPVDVDASVAALVSSVDRGILVTDLWYTRVLDPKTLVVTGLTRNGVWLIEQGKVTTPVRNFRFTQSYPQALGPGSVLGVGACAASLPDPLGIARVSAPALHLASWNFTGTASG
jgi:predicted Zn-dependent protease